MATGTENKEGIITDDTTANENATRKKLRFAVVKSSSYSSSYFPENILHDKPSDQSSRWSSESCTPPQFLILKLQRVSIVHTIKFGKYEKNHVCNLKKFKIYGGLSEEGMVELLDSGLKNDATAEVFELKHEFGGLPIPCQYLKIVPIQSWGHSFNFSIWFVELYGINDFEAVQPCIARYISYREREAIRVCLKHLRDHNHIEAFESLQKKTKIQLEDPLMTELFNTLVIKGDYIGAEKLFERCASNNLFHEFVSRQDYKASWSALCTECPEVSLRNIPQFVRPGMRGGHQMCIDPDSEMIYIYGGWDGNTDLADFWSYNISTEKWTLISSNTENEGGPSARSCHKMCLDPNRKQIFTLGHYVDSQCRPTRNMLKSDFYVYDIETNQWTLISEDTAAVGGPQLVFDHQMCIDPEKGTIYVFGGRILTGSINVIETLSLNSHVIAAMGMVLNGPNVVVNRMEDAFLAVNRHNDENPQGGRNYLAHMREMLLAGGGDELPEGRQQHPLVGHGNEAPPAVVAGGGGVPPPQGVLNTNASSPSSANSELLYSGLYAYHIPTSTWTLLRCDVGTPKPIRPKIRSRTGHCMLFHPTLRKMFIFAGQRCKEYLNDFFTYNVDTDEVEQILDGQKNICNVSPAAGFTQRATIDFDLNEIYIFSGASRDREKREENVQNSFWVFDMKKNSWSCIYRNDSCGDACASEQEPCPRFAHQLVYDHKTKLHYLFGGNPGKPKDQKMRLDDLWKLRLIKPTVEDLVKECRFLLRRHQFEELAISDPLNALIYLQTSIYEIIDHSNPEEIKEFHRLALLLFTTDEETSDMESESSESMDLEHSKKDEQIFKRSQLFDTLAHYFPGHMTQPKINLVDLLPI